MGGFYAIRNTCGSGFGRQQVNTGRNEIR